MEGCAFMAIIPPDMRLLSQQWCLATDIRERLDQPVSSDYPDVYAGCFRGFPGKQAAAPRFKCSVCTFSENDSPKRTQKNVKVE
jgi:hypothetical protein